MHIFTILKNYNNFDCFFLNVQQQIFQDVNNINNVIKLCRNVVECDVTTGVKTFDCNLKSNNFEANRINTDTNLWFSSLRHRLQ